ncbi:exonuclease SbcC (plasmid) [Vibrio nigripulchritudo]|uniref:GspE/PulE family protein n=1 Tax=Vibrio nigripulchritudo TaxID=28173 RepID=UPI00190CEAC7|nr:ATPase, T2SS/T4P/T4SS family [Vibrio nigripulchritudo]BCL74181.1 exonuclease SbcC [Vibrio nigripulchritudo]
MDDRVDALFTEELKTIYFLNKDTVLLVNGVILTNNFESESVRKLKEYVKKHPEDFLGVKCRVKKASDIELERYYKQDDTRDEVEDMSEVKSRITEILQKGVDLGCSDIHIELYRTQTKVYAEVDGQRQDIHSAPEYEWGHDMFSVLFTDLGENTDSDFSQSKSNNGTLELTLTDPKTNEPRSTSWRMSYIPAKDNGGKTTLRWTNGQQTIPELEELGWEDGHVHIMRKMMRSPSGLIIFVGKTGSGKTTSLAAVLEESKSLGRVMHTLEDPPEFDLGIMQTPVPKDDVNGEDINYRSKILLRHAVGIEMNGEVRDNVGAMSVCRKAETGQLMYTTMHTSSPLGIPHTLHDQMGVPLSVITSADLMKLWVYQTLVPKLCSCALSYEEIKDFYETKNLEGFEEIESWYEYLKTELNSVENVRFKHPVGCSKCNNGTKGRTALVEMLIPEKIDREFIANQDYIGWQESLIERGYKTVRDHALLKIERGEIDVISASTKVDNLRPQSSSDIYRTQLKYGGGHEPG